jgi:hypothetical protein
VGRRGSAGLESQGGAGHLRRKAASAQRGHLLARPRDERDPAVGNRGLPPLSTACGPCVVNWRTAGAIGFDFPRRRDDVPRDKSHQRLMTWDSERAPNLARFSRGTAQEKRNRSTRPPIRDTGRCCRYRCGGPRPGKNIYITIDKIPSDHAKKSVSLLYC